MSNSKASDGIESNFLVDTDPISKRKDAVAVRSFDNALRMVVTDDLLPEWSTEELTALLANIIRYQCNRSGVEIFAKTFKNTTPEDIIEVIDKLRQINAEASRERFILPAPGDRPTVITSEEPSTSAAESAELDDLSQLTHKFFADWSSGALLASRTRRIFDETPVLLPKLVVNAPVDGQRTNVPISRSPFSRVNNLLGAPNYERIYQLLGSMLSSRSLTKARSLDAAILLNILDDLDADTDKFLQHADFFRAALDEMSVLDPVEFKVENDVDERNIGCVSSNPLGFPQELFDLSVFLSTETPP